MPIAAIVVTLAGEADAHVLEDLGRDPRVCLGPMTGRRVPAVLDTANAADGEALFEEIRARAGVAAVDVVGIDFSEDRAGEGVDG
jgi:hypothetical protein